MNPAPISATNQAAEPWLEVSCSRHFTAWMAEQRVSLACTTYQTGKLLLFGRKPDGELAVFERTFNRCMGLWGDGQTLWMSTLFQLWRLENMLRPGELYQGHDRLYVPKIGFTTGNLDIHDIVVEGAPTANVAPDAERHTGRVVFVATGFNCLATLSERYSFAPLWRPTFISKITPEDRCHLNGLALVAAPDPVSAGFPDLATYTTGGCFDVARHGDQGATGGDLARTEEQSGTTAAPCSHYATAACATDEVDAWRDRRRDGGVVIEVPSSRLVGTGLSMPHSPRWHSRALWLLNSGTGYFGKLDIASGEFVPVTFCAGYLRGLAVVGDYAVVGLSRPRHDRTFGGLVIEEELSKRGGHASCGLQVIDLRTGDVAHWVRLDGMVSELYDVVALPGVARPMAFGFKTDEIQRTIAIGNECKL